MGSSVRRDRDVRQPARRGAGRAHVMVCGLFLLVYGLILCGWYLAPTIGLAWRIALALVSAGWIACHWILLDLLSRINTKSGRLADDPDAAALAGQSAVIEERQRLMLDLHDGVGSQLVTALRMARRDDIPRQDLARLIQDALDDLRLIVEAQDEAARDLGTLLQQWRQRNHARMSAIGMRLDWSLDPLAMPRPLSPREALQVLRILQEALNNAVQHSGSPTVHIILKAVPGGCELCVCDDGAALVAPSGLGGGRGLDGMRQRARRLGGKLHIGPGEQQGMVVSLTLPHATPA